MFEQNNVGVRFQNPVPHFLLSSQRQAGSAGGEEGVIGEMIPASTVDHVLAATQRIVSVIEGEEECMVIGEEDWEDASDEDEEEEEGEVDGEGESKEMQLSDLSQIELTQTENNFVTLQDLITSTGEENLYPPLDGTSFYTTICRINHSCVPNAMVRYRMDPTYGLCAEMIALRDIEENEELVQSYIDQTLGSYPPSPPSSSRPPPHSHLFFR
jgi:PHD/YefM family antitoxin component YafN of YafNO toxin-antitoxin module